MASKVKNWTEIFWPMYCAKNRSFLSEEQIVIDLITKIRGSRSSLLFWTLIEKDDLLIYNQKHQNIIARYYNIQSTKNPYFSHAEDTQKIQLRILTKVWEYLNREIIDYEHPESKASRTDK
jgi:hypothetical protein